MFKTSSNILRFNLSRPDIHFFYKQLVIKQLALGWQIAKQLSGLSPVSLSKKKNYRLRKSGVFFCNKRKMAVKPPIHQKLAVLKVVLGKF